MDPFKEINRIFNEAVESYRPFKEGHNMDWKTQAEIAANDLNSMIHRIEALPAHRLMTDALEAVRDAEKALREATVELHQIEIGARYDV